MIVAVCVAAVSAAFVARQIVAIRRARALDDTNRFATGAAPVSS